MPAPNWPKKEDDLPLAPLPSGYLKNKEKNTKLFNETQKYMHELEEIKKHAKNPISDSIEIKEKIILKILSDIDCMPIYKWQLYWTFNMPELNDYDRLNMPPDLVNSYDRWKVTIFRSSRFKNYSNWVWILIYILSIVMLTTYFLNS